MKKKKYHGYDSFLELSNAVRIYMHKQEKQFKENEKTFLYSKFIELENEIKLTPLNARENLLVQLLKKEKLQLKQKQIQENYFESRRCEKVLDLIITFIDNYTSIPFTNPISLNNKQKYYYFNGTDIQLEKIYNFLNSTKVERYFFIEGTSYHVFNKALSGVKFTKKINWRDTQMTLKYFIKKMYEYKLFEGEQMSWIKSEVTFLHKGNKIVSKNLSKSKDPVLFISMKIDSFFNSTFNTKN